MDNFKLVLVDFSWVYNKYYFVAKYNNKEDELLRELKRMLTQFFTLVSTSYSTSRIFLVMDSATKSTDNFKLNNEYKQNRDKEKKKEVYSLLREVVLEVNKIEGIKFVKAKGFEADDLIAHFVITHPLDSTLIYSGDKDLIQLTAIPDTYIADKFEKGKFLVKTDEDLFDKFKNSKGENFTRISKDKCDILKYRSLKGDPSDNLPPVFPRIRDKDIVTIVKDYWLSNNDLTDYMIDDMIHNISKDNEVLASKLEKNKETWLTNYRIMNLLEDRITKQDIKVL